MKKISFLIVLLLAISISYSGEKNESILVSTSWLAEHIKDPNLVILQVASNRNDYKKGHIPGARYLWAGWFAISNPELSYEVVPLEQLDSNVEQLGISNNSRVILCCVNGNVSSTARMYLTLEYLGMGKNTSILDGGFDVWKKEEREVSKEAPTFARGKFTPKVQPDVFVKAEWVNENCHNPNITIIDARAPEFYNGTSKQYSRDGHVPGAKNLYFSTLVDSTNKYLPIEKIQELFSAAGVKTSEIASYCHSGQTGSTVYFAARLLGLNAHLYDGSYEEWNSREEFPVETTKVDSTKK